MTSKTNNRVITGSARNDGLEGGDGNDIINGLGGNDRIDGEDGNDAIDGGDGNDTIEGGDGSDLLSGGSGNDVIDGGDDGDLIDGGAGVNKLTGGSGSDVFVFRMADHAGEATGTRAAYSTIDGGRDTDVLTLSFTRAEWLRSDVQADVARFVAYSRGGASGTFTFTAFNLKVEDVELLAVLVDGVLIDPRDDAVTVRADAIAATEDAPSVAFDLLANDSVPDLVKGVTVTNGQRGTVTLTQDLSDAANPVARAVYTPNATAFQYLAAGEKATDSFTYTVTDADGDVATATVTVTITGTNDGPTIVSGIFAGAVTEDAAATLSAAGAIVFSDVDLTDTHSVSVGAARVSVSGNPPAGFAPAGGFGTLTAVVVENVTDQNPQGTLNWSFSANSAAVQKLAAGQTATQIYALTLTDRNGASVVRDVTITLTGTNDAPTIGAVTGSGAVSEDGVTAVSGGIAFADVDLVDTHSVASAAQGTGYRGVFATTIDNSATGDGAGNVKWTFTADNAALQDLVRGEVLTQKYNVTVKDASGASVAQVVTVTITGTNDAPVAVADVASATEDGAIVTGSVATNDRDVDRGATLSYGLNAPVAGLTLNADGSYRFNPSDAAYQSLAKDQVQTIVANYTVRDEHGATAAATLTINVTGTNDGPMVSATQGSGTVIEAGNLDDGTLVAGTPVATGVLTSSDVDAGATATWSGARTTAYGSFAIAADGAWSFTLDNAVAQSLPEGASVTQQFIATVTDDKGASTQQGVVITITGTNDAPIVTSTQGRGTVIEAGNLDDGTAVAGTPVVTGVLTASDADGNGAALVWSGGRTTAYGSFAIAADGAWTFTLDNAAAQSLPEGALVTQQFIATVTDDKGASTQQGVVITITGTNDAPIVTSNAAAASGAVIEAGSAGAGVATATGQLASSDVDANGPATWSGSADGTYGRFAIDAAGLWTYSLDNGRAATQALTPNDVKTDSFTALVTDDKGATARQVVTVTVTGAADAPVAVADTAAATEDMVVTGSVATNDRTDPGGMLTFALAAPVAGLAFNPDGSYAFNAGDAAYQSLAKGETKAVVAPYRATDQSGASSASTLTITVVGANDAPTIVSASPMVTIDEIPDGTPNENRFTRGTEGTVLFADVDTLDLHSVTATPIGVGYRGTFSVGISQTSDRVNYAFSVPEAALDSLAAGQTLVQDYRIVVSDDHGGSVERIVTVRLSGNNDAPEITSTVASASGTVVEAGSLENGQPSVGVERATGQLTLSDPDTGATARWSVAQKDGAYGRFEIDRTTGTWTYTLDNKATATQALGDNASAIENFTVTVIDDKGATATQVVRVTVTGTNDAPDARAVTATVLEGGMLDARLTATDFDSPANDLRFELVSPVRGLDIGNDGRYRFDANRGDYDSLAKDEVREIVATYSVADQEKSIDTSTLTIRVTGINDAPVAQARTLYVDEDQLIPLTFNASDRDAGAQLSYRLLNVPDGVYGSPDGSFRFDASDLAYQSLDHGETRSIPIDYEVRDEHGATARSTVTVVVNGRFDKAKLDTTALDANIDQALKTIVRATAPDPRATLEYQLANLSAELEGKVKLDKDGKFEFTPDKADYAKLAAGETQVETIGIRVVSLYAAIGDDTGNGGNSTNGSYSDSTITVTVTGVNDAPIAIPDVVTVLEDTVVTGNVSLNDLDPDEKVGLTYTLNAPVAGLTLNANGSYAFDGGNAAYQSLTTGQIAPLIARYTATDSEGASSETIINILVIGRNDTPTTPGALVRVAEDAVASGMLSASGADGALTFSLLGNAAGLTLLPNGQYTFDARDPAYQSLRAGEVMPIAVPYKVVNGSNQTAINTFLLEVTGRNDAPVARADQAVVIEDATLNGSVALNDTDVDRGDTRTYALTTPVAGLTLNANGSYSFDARNAAYQSLANGEVRNVAAQYRVTDAAGLSSTATLTLTVIGANDALRVNDLSFSGTLDEDTSFNLPDIVLSDVDSARVTATLRLVDSNKGSFTYTTLSGGAASGDATTGALVLSGTVAQVNQQLASVTFVPRANVTGDVQIITSFSDGVTAVAGTGTLQIRAVNDAPVATNDVTLILEDTVLAGSVAINDIDADGRAGLVYALTAPVAGLSFNLDGSYRFDATGPGFQSLGLGQTRTIVANYFVVDQAGASDTATLTILVAGTNDAPVVDDAGPLGYLFSAAEDDVDTGLLPGRDPDANAVLRFSSTQTVPGLTLASNGQLTFDGSHPDYQAMSFGEGRTIPFDYTITDQHGAAASARINILLGGRNDAPVARADTAQVVEDSRIMGSVAANDGDPDIGDRLSYALAAPVAGLTLGTAGGYTFNADDAAYQSIAKDMVRDVVANYIVTDAAGASATSTLTIRVTGVNDAPVIDAPRNLFGVLGGDAYAFYTVKNQPLFGFLPGRDVDAGASISFAVSFDDPNTGLTIGSNGQFTFVPTDAVYQALNGYEFRQIGVSYTITDEFGATAFEQAFFYVWGRNDAPVVRPDSVTAREDTVVTGNVSTNDSDDFFLADATYALTAPVAGLTIDADGNFRFDARDAAYQALANGQTRDVVATYSVTDDFGARSSSTLTIIVTGVDESGGASFAQVDASTFDSGSGSDIVGGSITGAGEVNLAAPATTIIG